MPQSAVRPTEEERALSRLLRGAARPRAGAWRRRDLRRLVRRQLAILKYVEFRFRPQVRVTPEEVEKAYAVGARREGATRRRSPPWPPALEEKLASRRRSTSGSRRGCASCARPRRSATTGSGRGPRSRGCGRGRGRPRPPRRRPTRVASVVAPGHRHLRDPEATPPGDVERLHVEGEAVEAGGSEGRFRGGGGEELEAALRVAEVRGGRARRTQRLKRRPMPSRYQGWRTSTFEPAAPGSRSRRPHPRRALLPRRVEVLDGGREVGVGHEPHAPRGRPASPGAPRSPCRGWARGAAR